MKEALQNRIPPTDGAGVPTNYELLPAIFDVYEIRLTVAPCVVSPEMKTMFAPSVDIKSNVSEIAEKEPLHLGIAAAPSVIPPRK